ncbi:uncharacterized protein LOC143599776 [Bidens hawaiensis]|uniref:uncharacterized protein LOC143582758 n=1 Tax=Bidens hawaiensis TaxID=980011 RepID=UPI0040490485
MVVESGDRRWSKTVSHHSRGVMVIEQIWNNGGGGGAPSDVVCELIIKIYAAKIIFFTTTLCTANMEEASRRQDALQKDYGTTPATRERSTPTAYATKKQDLVVAKLTSDNSTLLKLLDNARKVAKQHRIHNDHQKFLERASHRLDALQKEFDSIPATRKRSTPAYATRKHDSAVRMLIINIINVLFCFVI